jgi:hypothetical protein
MIQNLGKIFLLFIVPICIYANVSLNAPQSFFQGDSVEFSLSVSGKDIKMPDIKDIDGFIVQSLGTSTQTNIINGVRSDKLVKNYSFRPTKNITIPAFEISIDGKIEKTQPQKIQMQKVEKTVSNDYDLSISVDKKEVYVGESIHLTLLFKYKNDLNIIGLEFEKPKFESFWVKELKANENLPVDDKYTYQKLEYILFPQKSGKLDIGPLKIESVVSQNRYNTGFFVTAPTKRTKVYSNKIALNVKPLPQNVKLIGDFSIDATIDKTNVKEGEAVSYKLTINGRGNVDDIDEVRLNIADATVYENPSEKKYDFENNLYGGVYTKAFSIVPTKSFTIPEISLSYFDKETKSVKTIKTKSFDIKVERQEKKVTKLEVADNEPKAVDRSNKSQTIQIAHNEKILYFLLGLVVGVIGVVFIVNLKKKTRKQEETALIKTVRKAKTQNELLKIMVVFIKIDEDLDKMIFTLETKLDSEQFKSIKKQIIDILNNLAKKGIQLDTRL